MYCITTLILPISIPNSKLDVATKASMLPSLKSFSASTLTSQDNEP